MHARRFDLLSRSSQSAAFPISAKSKKNSLRFHPFSLRRLLFLLLFGSGFLGGLSPSAQAVTSFGSVAVGSTSPVVTVTFTLSIAATLNSTTPYQVLTLGVPELEFADAGGATCTASASIASGGTCTVNVTFAPQWAGLRLGAVVLEDTNGNTLATAPLNGVGTGPQIAFGAVYEKILATHLTTAVDVAVDTNGDTYIVDQGTAYVYKISPSQPGVRHVVGGNWVTPKGVALDGAGNVYVADYGQKAVIEVAPNGNMTTVPVTLQGPIGVAVDGAGNLYIADEAGGVVYKVAPSGTHTTIGSNIPGPTYLALDSAGNVYVGDFYNSTIYEITTSGTQKILSSSVTDPLGIAVDAAGNVYAASGSGTSQSVYEISPSGTLTTVVNETAAGSDPYPSGIALDAAGNLYVANSNAGNLLLSANVAEYVRSVTPPVTFYTSTDAGKTDTADGPQTVPVQNIGTSSLIFTAPESGANPSYPSDFPENTSESNLCTSTTTLATSASCNVSMNFVPPSGGAITGDIVLTNNNLNQAGATQTIVATGTGIGADPQTITFNPIGSPVTFGVAPIALSATATSGLTVTFSVISGPATVNNTTDLLTITGAGTVVVQASQPGSSSYIAAPNVQQTLIVNPATPTITWATPVAITYGTALSATQLNATGSVPGNLVYTPGLGTVLKAGPQSLSVTLTPTDSTDYASVTQTVTLTVNPAAPTITWATPAAIRYGTALTATQLDATASVPGTFAYTPASGTVLKAGSQTLSVTFTPTDTADYSTATASTTLNVTQATPTITWTAPAAIVYGTALTATQLNATTSIPGTFVYSPASGTVLTAGTQTLSVTFTPTDVMDYTTTTGSTTLIITKATPSVSWTAPASIPYGTALSATQLDATASTTGTFTYTPAAGTVLKVGAQTLSVTFTPADTTDYTTATGSTTLTVTQATPVITWAKPAAITYGTGLSSTQLDAKANTTGTFTYTPASGTVLKAGSQTLSVTFKPSDTTDYATAKATTTLTVNAAKPAIHWTAPAAISYGTALSATQLNATASVPGTFAYTPALGAVLTAGKQTLSVTFTPNDTTDYAIVTTTTTITVNRIIPVVTWATPAPITFGTPLSSTQLDAKATGAGGASLPGVFNYSYKIGAVLGAGTATLTVSFTPTDETDYYSGKASVTLVIDKATPIITWATPAAITYGTALSSKQLNATANTKGTFVYSPASGTVLDAGQQTLTVVFTPTATTDYTTASASVVLTVNQATPKLTWAAPAPIIYGTALSATQLNATASVAGTFTYTPPAGKVLSAGTQTLKAAFVPANIVDYTSHTASVSLTVNKATPEIAWATPAAVAPGTALSSTQLNATVTFDGAAVPGSYTYAPPAGTVLSTVGKQTLSVSFVPTNTTDFVSPIKTTTTITVN